MESVIKNIQNRFSFLIEHQEMLKEMADIERQWIFSFKYFQFMAVMINELSGNEFKKVSEL